MTSAETIVLSMQEAEELCFRATLGVGADVAAARSLARATVAAEADGQPTLGLSHLTDYLDGYRTGRIAAGVTPMLTRPLPTVIRSDAAGGLAHLGFDLAFDDLVSAARNFGVAIFSQSNAFTCGALGYFAGRLAEQGLVAFAATNGPALMAGSGSTQPVYCTNPLAFAAPGGADGPLLIDQASSATAFVNIRNAAQNNEPIPEGWAVGSDGKNTTDPQEAMKGALLAFGGTRGANIALMLEVLSAGLTGANWSLDAPSFTSGSESPGSGLFILAIDPKVMEPDFEHRMEKQLRRLSDDYGVHIPGRSKHAHRLHAGQSGLAAPREIVAELEAAAQER
ncbi:(2R)-3-sulfolactate dehydrogenase (NADP+) [Mesorhizobium sp. J18]|uniref:Ldh family oxidoreductase n=1 Tax=Mesorhizobium sp. J18 TaxID=935263 RepID=UPI00119A1708|nr:Ldh family oxidoreductase [Mesorhizobium sp. J18]TWG95521.1 (2R)-3-sulfolactate dehydrogenase (NADP+) [Mesorhizobium sp. J18]